MLSSSTAVLRLIHGRRGEGPRRPEGRRERRSVTLAAISRGQVVVVRFRRAVFCASRVPKARVAQPWGGFVSRTNWKAGERGGKVGLFPGG